MLIKFFKKGVREEPGSLSYLLENNTARVLRGCPELTQMVIDHSPQGLSQRFVSGVINNLADLDVMYDDILLDELELMCLSGRPKSSMPWCAIQHEDKDKREIHFVIPKFDLVFGKWITPYLDRIDRIAWQAWTEHFALRHNLELAREKLRTRPPFEHMRAISVNDLEFLQKVWDSVHYAVEQDSIKSRSDLERYLREEGHSVRFMTHKGAPLQQPVILGPTGKSLRLSNSIYYYPDFGTPAPKPINRKNKRAVAARLVELDKIMGKWRDFRAFKMIGWLFGKKKQPKRHQRTARRILQQLIKDEVSKQTPRNPFKGNTDYYSIFETGYYMNTPWPKDWPKSMSKLILPANLEIEHEGTTNANNHISLEDILPESNTSPDVPEIN